MDAPLARPPRRTALRRLMSAALYVAYLVAVVIGMTYVVYPWRIPRRPSVQTTSDEGVTGAPLPAGVDAIAASRLGTLAPVRRHGFGSFPASKRPGTVRVGCFGDSYT